MPILSSKVFLFDSCFSFIVYLFGQFLKSMVNFMEILD